MVLRRLQSLLSVSKLGGPARAPRAEALKLTEEDGGSPKLEVHHRTMFDSPNIFRSEVQKVFLG